MDLNVQVPTGGWALAPESSCQSHGSEPSARPSSEARGQTPLDSRTPGYHVAEWQLMGPLVSSRPWILS